MAPNHPILHHNFHQKRHQAMALSLKSTTHTGTSLNCHGLMPIYGIMYVWIGNIFEIVIFQGFGTT